MMGFETVIFDLDGTLLDTLDDLMDACNYALRQVGAPERTRAEVRRFVGNGLGLLMERALPNGRENPRYDEALACLQSYYDTHNRIKTAPYSGVSDLVQTLIRRGIAVAVVSNKPDTSVKPLVAEFFPHMFPVAIGERPGVRRKPAPDTVWEALKELGKNRESAVYVGDSEVDLATARNAGIPCISVTWGFRDRDVLDAAGGTRYAASPSDVLTWLQDGF